MLRVLPRLILATYLARILIGMAVLAADPKEVVHRSKITTASRMETSGQNIMVDTELLYNWTRVGQERLLRFESALVKERSDGKPMNEYYMCRERITSTEGGKTRAVPIEKAPEELKKMLQDCFDAPICKLQVDEHGRAVKRTLVAGPGAKSLIDNGMIANAVLFHPPFLRDRDEWEADTEVTMGNGGYARGKLTYKKAVGRNASQTVTVSGTLTNEGFKQPGVPVMIKKASYVVRGEQSYDPAQQEWVSGRMSIDVAYQMIAGEKDIASTGTMVLNFQKLPGN